MKYNLKDFIPLIAIVGVIFIATCISSFFIQADMITAMRLFMAYVFLVFGTCKVVTLPTFVEAYRLYDLLAARSTMYAYIYPFIECALGLAYLINIVPFWTNVITFILMSFSALGVALALYQGKNLMCGCLGGVFKLPMTWVTLVEDLVMAGMALWMLLR